MMQQPLDLYPARAGAKVATGPSRAAAEGVTASAKRHDTHAQILATLRDHGPATADEIADRLGLDRLYVRPRVSELRATGRVRDHGTRRKNPGGRTATVWEAV